MCLGSIMAFTTIPLVNERANLSHPTPLYVHHIDPNSNAVIVGDKDALNQHQIKLHTFSTVSGKPINSQKWTLNFDI